MIFLNCPTHIPNFAGNHGECTFVPAQQTAGRHRLLHLQVCRPQTLNIKSHSTCRVLANYAVDEIFIGQTPSWLFEEGDKGRVAREVFSKFSQNLAQAETKMRKRNEGLKVPYTVIYPSKIPAGIAV